ncbi:hypothetical protein KEM54_004479 [Ascosphaera aggregata]|nr:hypothetical protein KEM54_004479 [Ascosphaera aggregata]
MSGVFNNLFGGGQKASPSPIGDDAGFDDFGALPSLSRAPASLSGSAASMASQAASLASASSPFTAPSPRSARTQLKPVVYTKWYRIWERTAPADFITEAIFIPAILLVCLFHMLGMRRNRRRARTFAQTALPILQDEYALVGYGRTKATQPAHLSPEDIKAGNIPDNMLKERAANEFTMYATGRQHVAFLDVEIITSKWYNPFVQVSNMLLSYVFESLEAPIEKVTLVAYAFDGHEKDLVPAIPAESEEIERKAKRESSTYDGFVFSIVHKNVMRKLREVRYDVSLTQTKDNPKLPQWATVMTESAEITDAMLTKELIQAVEEVGEKSFEYLIITDQPEDKPVTLEETKPRKRVALSFRLPSGSGVAAYTSTLPLLKYFVNLPDRLVSVAHFRPEVMRKVRSVREEEVRKLRRAEEEKEAEERKLALEKVKREERQRMLRGMTADEQRKFLEKEREKEARKGSKRRVMRA